MECGGLLQLGGGKRGKRQIWMQIHFHVRMHLQHQHSRRLFVTEQWFCFELVKQIKIKIVHHGTMTIVKQRRIFEVVTVGTHHDCEENEIVKWFPLYEGDAMFPAKRTWCFKQRLFFSKNTPLKKRFTWMDFWDWDTQWLSGLDLGVVLLPHDGPAFLDPSAIKKNFYGHFHTNTIRLDMTFFNFNNFNSLSSFRVIQGQTWYLSKSLH